MVSSPGYVLTAHLSPRDECQGDPPTCRRISEFISRVRESTVGELVIPPVSIQVREVIASHSGLGSGTQLGLAVACALSCLSGEPDAAIETLARRTGRGLRSAIGLYGFSRGGILIDGGRSGSGHLGTLVSRMEVPEDWRLVLAAPPDAAGLSGSDEQRAFAAQPTMPQSLTAELCRIALMEWLPSLVESDFARVSRAMYDYGQLVGQFFAPVQGGVFAHSLMADLAEEARRRGYAGIAQTSWGPTVCVLCEDEQSARVLVNDLSNDSRFASCLFRMTAPLNRGARVDLSG